MHSCMYLMYFQGQLTWKITLNNLQRFLDLKCLIMPVLFLISTYEVSEHEDEFSKLIADIRQRQGGKKKKETATKTSGWLLHLLYICHVVVYDTVTARYFECLVVVVLETR